MDSNVTVCHINLAKGFRGGERQTELLVREFAKGGQRQKLVCREGEALQARLADVPALEILPIRKPFSLSVGVLKGAGVVLCHEAKAAHIAWLNRKLGGAPYVIIRRQLKPPRSDKFTQAVYQRASAVVAISSAVKSLFPPYSATNRQLVITDSAMRLPVNDEMVRSIRGSQSGQVLLVCVAALCDADKGQAVLIEALKLLAPDASWRMIFVGSGDDEQRFKDAASGLSNVDFVGFKTNVGDYFEAADIVVIPSRREAMGTVSIEAMAHGRATVASRIGGLAEVLEHNCTGLLVPSDEPVALAEALTDLILDSDKRDRLGKAAMMSATRFLPENMANQYSELCRKLVEL